jgi:hypothetical protein
MRYRALRLTTSATSSALVGVTACGKLGVPYAFHRAVARLNAEEVEESTVTPFGADLSGSEILSVMIRSRGV